MTAITTTFPAGVAGDVTRQLSSEIESGIFDTTKVPAAFGLPVKMVAGKVTKIEAGDTVESFWGILTRSVPSIAGSASVDTPNGNSIPGVLVKGYINVKCPVGTPVKNGAVYMRIVADTGKAIGDFEATADNTITAAAMVGTGNATAGTMSVTGAALPGVYRALFTAATTFDVYGPNGDFLKSGVLATPVVVNGVTFTLTAGATPAIATDYILITVANKSVALKDVVWGVGGKDANNITEIRIK